MTSFVLAWIVVMIIRGYIIHGFTVQFMLDRALSVMYALCTYLSLVPKEKFGEY